MMLTLVNCNDLIKKNRSGKRAHVSFRHKPHAKRGKLFRSNHTNVARRTKGRTGKVAGSLAPLERLGGRRDKGDRKVRNRQRFGVSRGQAVLDAGADNGIHPPEDIYAGAWKKLGLSANLIDRLRALNLTRPTTVQAVSIPRVLKGVDTAIQCYTGSGKTLAYLLPIYVSREQETLGASSEEDTKKSGRHSGCPRGLVVAPTRELAMQITQQAEKIGGRSSAQQVIGGANFRRQLESFRAKPLVVAVGTPGRLFDHLEKNLLPISNVRTLVIDEADEMLSESRRNNFRKHLVAVVEGLRKVRGNQFQIVLVSASLSPSIMHRAHVDLGMAMMKRVVSERVPPPPENQGMAGTPAAKGGANTPRNSTITADEREAPALAPGVKHYFVFADQRHRADMARRVLFALKATQALVFVNKDTKVRDLVFRLQRQSLEMTWLEASMNKRSRREHLDMFRSGKVKALAVTDVLARGLDVPRCDVVVNLDPPRDVINYVHRAGRTGRLGRKGVVVTILTPKERIVMKKVKRSLSQIAFEEAFVAHGRLQSCASAIRSVTNDTIVGAEKKSTSVTTKANRVASEAESAKAKLARRRRKMRKARNGGGGGS